jgi:hypothetical protein
MGLADRVIGGAPAGARQLAAPGLDGSRGVLLIIRVRCHDSSSFVVLDVAGPCRLRVCRSVEGFDLAGAPGLRTVAEHVPVQCPTGHAKYVGAQASHVGVAALPSGTRRPGRMGRSRSDRPITATAGKLESDCLPFGS